MADALGTNFTTTTMVHGEDEEEGERRAELTRRGLVE
jgi:hypothetical protein